MVGTGQFWGIYAAAGLVAFFCWYWLCAGLRSTTLRDIARTSAFAMLAAPAPVPGYPEQFAPAWIVVGVEAFLQRNGDPLPAATLLLIVVVVLLALVALWRYLRSGRSNP